MDTKVNFSHVALHMFNGENYNLWAVRMENYLEALDVWEAVEGITMFLNYLTILQLPR